MMSLFDDKQADIIDAFNTTFQIFGFYFNTLIPFISTIWYVKYTFQSSNLIKQFLLPRPRF